MRKAIDKDDLLALEDSFDSDIALAPPGSSSNAIVVDSSPPKHSPVKPHNKQFENDFDSDFSDDLEEILPPKPKLSQHSSQISRMAKNFTASSSPAQSQKGMPISQLKNQQRPFNAPQPPMRKPDKLADLEDIFASDMGDSQSFETAKQSLPKPESQLEISAPETSSPTYHRLETVYPQLPASRQQPPVQAPPVQARSLKAPSKSQPKKGDTNAGREDNPFLVQDEPIDVSTQVEKLPTEGLYPSFSGYDKKFGKSELELHTPVMQKHVLIDLEAENEDEPLVGASLDVARRATTFPAAQKETPKYQPQAQPTTIGVNQKRLENAMNNILKRPKKENAQITLMTQQSTNLNQARHMATESKFDKVPKPEKKSKTEKKPEPKKVQPVILSEEQQHISDLVMRGHSLFYTGSAGTGKSILLREIIKKLHAKKRSGSVCVTASTGLAACNIGGITLHSFAGIGLGREPADVLAKKVKRNRKAASRWKGCEVLIIDEISMISGELFEKLDHIACEVRKNDRPFGGIQVIACGDFFQLPPVSRNGEATFCFQSRAWKRTMTNSITLQKVFRQKGDIEFIDMLNDMRMGLVTTDSLRKFQALERELPMDDIEPAELFATRDEVDRANSLRLRGLTGASHVYNAKDGGILENQEQREKLLSHFMAPPMIELKKGAQVMMIKNIDETLLNGSLGKVIDFVDRDTYLSYEKTREGLSAEALEQHVMDTKMLGADKDRGATIDDRIIGHDDDVLEETIFDFLSDCESDDPEQDMSIKRKKSLLNDLHKSSRGQKLPLVRFKTPTGHTRTVMVNPETWVVEDERQRPLVTRMQLPLLLAWSLSIHKSQGQTLARVRVNLARVFEKGQAYVAISRAVNREGLQILNFDETKVFAHPKVIEFYSSLSTAEGARAGSTAHDLEDAEPYEPYDLGAERLEREEREYMRRAGRQFGERAPEQMYVPARERVATAPSSKRTHDEIDFMHQNSMRLEDDFVEPPMEDDIDPSYNDGSSEAVPVKKRLNKHRRAPEIYDLDFEGSSSEVVGRVYSP